MSRLFSRNSYDERPTEIRRILLVAGALIVASAAWYAVRPLLIYQLALHSIGCPLRWHLLTDVLCRRNPSIPTDDRLSVSSYDQPRPGWLLAHTQHGMYLADHRFQLIGVFSRRYNILTPPADRDADGHQEVLLSDPSPGVTGNRCIGRWFLLRFGHDRREVAWVALVDGPLWISRRKLIAPIWRDEDGDGLQELVWLAFVPVPQGGSAPPSQTVATFEWDSPGGTLIPRHLPDDCGILPWAPPEARPVTVGQDAELTPILEALCPLPDDFGTPWPPASSTAPALPPSSP